MRIVQEGVGAVLLMLFPYYLPFIQPSNLALYHHPLPVANLIGGLLIDVLAFSVLLIGLLTALQYLHLTLQEIFSALFIGLMLWRIVDLAILMQTRMPIIASWESIRRQSCIVILLLSGILAYFLPRVTRPAARGGRVVIAAFAFCSLWIIPKLLHLVLVHQPDKGALTLNPLPPTPGGSNRRIVWILFDELSYDQAFDHLALGIRLPNFDRLSAESVSFSNVKAAGFYTDSIIPSLFVGRRIDQIRSSIDGDLLYNDESNHSWLTYDPNVTLFALAKQNGWSSGVDGGPIPYCRILAQVLNACYWVPGSTLSMEDNGASEEKPALVNALALPNQILAFLTSRRNSTPDQDIASYQKINSHAGALIDDNRLRFVYLHFPVPHPPGIYDRQRHIVRLGGTYLDNLVLADDILGTLLQKIDATPSARQTIVIISSDHSWRTPLWRFRKGWSSEEELATKGRFDERPVLLIHFPDQMSGNRVDVSLPELLEHDIIAGMLRNRIKKPADLMSFLPQSAR